MSKAITSLLRIVFYMLKKFVWNVRNLLSKSFLRYNFGLSAFSEIAVDVSGERKKVYFRIFSSLSISMHLSLYVLFSILFWFSRFSFLSYLPCSGLENDLNDLPNGEQKSKQGMASKILLIPATVSGLLVEFLKYPKVMKQKLFATFRYFLLVSRDYRCSS